MNSVSLKHANAFAEVFNDIIDVRRNTGKLQRAPYQLSNLVVEKRKTLF